MIRKIILSSFLLIHLFIFSQVVPSNTVTFEIATKFTKNLTKNKCDSAYNFIDTAINKSYTATYLQYIWKSLIDKYGEYKKISKIREHSSINHQVFYQDITFKKGSIILKLSFTTDKLTGVHFLPANPKGKYINPTYDKKNYTEKEVIIPCTDGIRLPATLTIPNNISKPAIILLVHGSGPNDRDEKIYHNKPFKDISIGLATLGIATLRYEKRTLEFEDEMVLKKDSITIYDETINDAVSAVNYLSLSDEIDAKKIFVLGHSLGGMCNPKIAKISGNVKGIIIMAGNARPLEDLIVEQVSTLLKQDSTNFQMKMTLNQIKYQVGVLHSDTFSLQTKKIYLPLSIPAKYWLSLRQYNQVNTAAVLNKPILVLQGERDYQVTMTDFNIWKSKCNKSTTNFKSYEKLNHLFMEGKGKSTPSEYEKPNNVAFYVIEDIYNWVLNLK